MSNPRKTINLPPRRPLNLDEDAIRQFEDKAERAGGGTVQPLRPAEAAPEPAARPAAPAEKAPEPATAPAAPAAKAAPEPARAPETAAEGSETPSVPAAFAELLDEPRGVARGRGTVAEPRVRIVDGRAVRASTVHLPVELYDQVDTIAHATGRSRSSIIEWALQKMLAG